MKIKLHKLEHPAHFERLRSQALEARRQTHETLSSGKCDAQFCYRTLCEDSLWLACIALILGRGDDEARGYFRDAVEYAPKWLKAPGSTGAPRVYEVNLEVSPGGVRPTAIHERVPSREPSRLSLGDFTKIIFTITAFGQRSSFAEVANFAEESYRNPDEVASPEAFGHMRAWKAWLRDDESGAKREALAVLKATKTPAVEAGVAALLALATGDREGFLKHLEERLTHHKKHYQRAPNEPLGSISLHGMALCRLAIDRGMELSEGPYLPLRFLPSYSASRGQPITDNR